MRHQTLQNCVCMGLQTALLVIQQGIVIFFLNLNQQTWRAFSFINIQETIQGLVNDENVVASHQSLSIVPYTALSTTTETSEINHIQFNYY